MPISFILNYIQTKIIVKITQKMSFNLFTTSHLLQGMLISLRKSWNHLIVFFLNQLVDNVASLITSIPNFEFYIPEDTLARCGSHSMTKNFIFFLTPFLIIFPTFAFLFIIFLINPLTYQLISFKIQIYGKLQP